MFDAMTKSAIGAWREHFGMSKNEVIRRTGLARNTVYSAEGEGIASAATLIAIANCFGITVAELLRGPPEHDSQEHTTVRSVPLFDGIPTKGGPWNMAASVGEFEVLESDVIDPATVAVIVRGNSMYPTLLDGDVVLVNPVARTYESRDIVCAFNARTMTGVIGRLRIDGRIRGLFYDNPMWRGVPPSEFGDWEIIGKVVRLQDRDLTADAFWPKPDDVSEQH